MFLDQTLRLTFKEGIQLLKESGLKDENGNDLSEEEDLSTATERGWSGQGMGRIILSLVGLLRITFINTCLG